jgi:hypothetical protein
MLHREGELYLLSAGFMTGLSGYGPPPAQLFVGMDNRPSPQPADTLETVMRFESTSPSYRRIPVDTVAGFALTEEQGHPAIQCSLEWSVPEDGEPIGLVQQMFVCTVQAGSVGKLLQSIRLKKPRDITDGMIFTGEMMYGFLNLEEVQQ